MGMAMPGGFGPYPRPKVKKYGGIWTVFWTDIHNQMWYYQPGNWDLAIKYALGLK